MYRIPQAIRISTFSSEGVRSISTSWTLNTIRWRREQGLPARKNTEGPLVDGADYTFLDGRPTPLMSKQKVRMLKQQDFARKIIELNGEVDFAVQRHKDLEQQAQQEREHYINQKLKPKGKMLK